MKPILEIQNVWKAYKIGQQRQRYLSLRDSLVNSLRFRTSKKETFWALQDVSFEVYEGECVGIIGRNGAGKSTLLKILSKITPPTKGRIIARGRVASLLEVGTGFHPELTGRENIYLNGSILGLKRAEINRKFDEIVDFSGVEQFLDTPLKHYSSGMQLRLAFSVAAHLEPEILLIDEVLAVGDAEFQKKCLGKMDEVSKSGRTVLFVSHNMGAVRQLCERSILLKDGRYTVGGATETVLNHHYLNAAKQHSIVPLSNRKDRQGSGLVQLTAITLLDADRKPVVTNTVVSGEQIYLKIDYEADSNVYLRQFELGLSIYNRQNQFITVLNNRMANYPLEGLSSKGTLLCRLEANPFICGHYFVEATLVVNGQFCDKVYDAFQFSVIEGDFYHSGYTNARGRTGVYVEQEWVSIAVRENKNEEV